MPEIVAQTQLSPQQLCQELVRSDPWRVLVVCLMLNQTSGVQVRRVFPEFFRRYPTPHALIEASIDDVKLLIRPLGFQNRRYERLLRMSRDYIVWDRNDVTELHGVGKYAADSYRIFVDDVIIDDAQDKELKKYTEWARTVQTT